MARFFIYVIAVFLYPSVSFSNSTAASCDCPELSCNTCEEQVGVQFYSDKCGPGGARVMSCQKPTCAPKDPLPATCQAKADKKSDRMPASQVTENAAAMVAKAGLRGVMSATVTDIEGAATITFPNQKSQPLKKDMKVHANDMLETSENGWVRLQFMNSKKAEKQNEVTVMPRSKMKVSEFNPESKVDRSKTVIELLEGKIRNKVREKAPSTSAYNYEVRTRTAVAGVRGTDFVVSYGKTQDAKATVNATVETLEGEVHLSDVKKEQSMALKAGESGSYVVAANDSKVFSNEEINEFVSKGYLTPVYKMNADEVARLKEDTRLVTKAEKERRMTTVKDVCKEPVADLNQCAWECVNNPSGSKTCKTELPNVHCVRRRCNANGQWVDDTRLPASFFEACPKKGLRVAPCDY